MSSFLQRIFRHSVKVPRNERHHYDSRQVQPSVVSSLMMLVQFRELIWKLTKYEIYIKYRKSALGILWSLLNPILLATIIYFVFGKLFGNYIPRDSSYASLVLSGILLQAYILSGPLSIVSAIQSRLTFSAKHRIPIAVVAISSALANMFQFLIGSIALIPLALIVNQSISIRAIFLPVYLFFSILWLCGIGILLLEFVLRFDDSIYIIGAVIMIVSYICPFFYPIDILSNRMKFIVNLNPLTQWVMGFRWLMYENSLFSTFSLVFLLLVSISIFLLAMQYLHFRWNSIIMWVS